MLVQAFVTNTITHSRSSASTSLLYWTSLLYSSSLTIVKVVEFTPEHPIAVKLSVAGDLSMKLSKDDLKRAYAVLAKANETSDAYSWVFARRPRWKKGALVAGSMSNRWRQRPLDVESMPI